MVLCYLNTEWKTVPHSGYDQSDIHITSSVRNKLKFLDGHVAEERQNGGRTIFPPWGKYLHKKNHKAEQKLTFQIKNIELCPRMRSLDHLLIAFFSRLLHLRPAGQTAVSFSYAS